MPGVHALCHRSRVVQAADLLGDIAATAHLASELAERLFPKPDEDDRLLENFMFDGSDDVWDAENFPFKEGTIRAATERRAAYSKQVRRRWNFESL